MRTPILEKLSNRITTVVLILLTIASLSITVSIIANKVQQVGLRQLAKQHNLEIGTAVSSWQLSDSRFSSLLRQEFNLITPENEMKFEILSPEPGQYDFSGADKVIEYANKYGLSVRGHTLVWTNQLPEWLKSGNYSRDELIIILHNHIKTVVGRYRGKVKYWDVVNESLAPDGSIALNNFWMKYLGSDYIALAFRWAHEADPDALLFYNEANAEHKGPKADGLVNLATSLLAQGTPLHGIGFEMHTTISESPKPEEFSEIMGRIASLGLILHITEMDVRIVEPATTADLELQAGIYAEMLHACLEISNCTSFATWGLTDGLSWIPHTYPGTGSPLLFFSDYSPKPAYYAIYELLEGK